MTATKATTTMTKTDGKTRSDSGGTRPVRRRLPRHGSASPPQDSLRQDRRLARHDSASPRQNSLRQDRRLPRHGSASPRQSRLRQDRRLRSRARATRAGPSPAKPRLPPPPPPRATLMTTPTTSPKTTGMRTTCKAAERAACRPGAR
jgi:hypothetical protein